MFGKLFTRLGLGGIRVDTVLETDSVAPGDTLRAEVRITGGDAAQQVGVARLELLTRCVVEGRPVEIPLVAGEVEIGLVQPGERITVPVEFDLPRGAPISVGAVQSLLRTTLVVPGAADACDHDAVTIRPARIEALVLEGIERAGFRLAEAEVEYDPRRDPPVVQEFDFRPGGAADRDLAEVELAFAPVAGGVELRLTVDRRGGLFAGGGECSTRLTIREDEADRIDMSRALRDAIARLR